ncbi:MAG: hypothetical protein KGL52_12620 [Rhodospirillales bacterium]|nr:hypothetical protein [Rhodospirillales bacterium]
MRKALLATAALLGMSYGIGHAAEISVVSTTPTGVSGFVSPQLKAKPGQIVVHLSFRENVYMEASWFGHNGTSSSGLASSNAGGDKLQPQAITGYSRIFGGFDAQTTSGLKYGAVMEIRENNFGTNSSGKYGGAGGGAPSTGASGQSFANTLYIRRGYGYIGTDQIGLLRIGEMDGPMSLFLTGVFDSLGTGGFNGDLNTYNSTTPIWPFEDVGNNYTTAKIMYLSPMYEGFQAAISYEPNSANLQDNYFTCSTADCFTTSSSNSANELVRRRNTIEAGIRYVGTLFGTVGINTSLTGTTAGRVNPGPTAAPALGTTSFRNQLFGDFGIALTYAGLTVGANVQGGRVNGQFANMPSGGHDELAYEVGGDYKIAALTFGAMYFSNSYQGWSGLHARRDQGVTIGANYAIAPGVNFLAEYDYGWRHQSGFDFYSGGPGANNNDVKEQIIGAGFQFAF